MEERGPPLVLRAGGRSGHSFVCRVLQDTTSNLRRPRTSSRSRDSWFWGWPPQRPRREVLRSHHWYLASFLTSAHPGAGSTRGEGSTPAPGRRSLTRPASRAAVPLCGRRERSRGRPKTQDLKIRRSNQRQEKRDPVRPCEIVYNFRYKTLQSHPSTAK